MDHASEKNGDKEVLELKSVYKMLFPQILISTFISMKFVP